MHLATSALVQAVIAFALLLYLLPTFIAVARDVVALPQIVLLDVFLGWTAAGWICALVLAFGPRRPKPPAAPPTRPLPPPPAVTGVYRDGVYLASAGNDTHTWAIREAGRWSIVYEVGGEERLTAEVTEADVPISVLAAALETAEGVR